MCVCFLFLMLHFVYGLLFYVEMFDFVCFATFVVLLCLFGSLLFWGYLIYYYYSFI